MMLARIWRCGSLAALTLGCAIVGCATGAAAHAEPAQRYVPEQPVSGVVRIWGHSAMSTVTRYWAEDFTRYHPDVRFEFRLMGSDTAMPGLYSGRADIALLGRENNITDDNGFGRVKGYRPLRLELMTGSLASTGKASALVVFVHRDNPLGELSLQQLAAIFGCDPAQAGTSVRTWGQLGLRGDWAGEPINLYSYDAQTNTGLFFDRVVLGGSHRMNWERLREFRDLENSGGARRTASQQSIDALRADRFGLAVSSLEFATPDVKPLALAAAAGQGFYAATRDTVIARTYPLTRRTFAFVDVPPGKSMAPRIREFLRYTLSLEGQAAVARDGGYLPLNDAVRIAQKELLR